MSRRGAQEILGGQMRFLRQAAGKTLAEIANHLGTSRGHLSNVERGRDRPSWDIVAYYEEMFHADGALWSVYVELLTSPHHRQRTDLSGRPEYPLRGDATEFVADVTIPDGTVMPPGFVFTKVWRIKNSGTVPWTGRFLARDGAPAGYGLPRSPRRTPIPDTQPGQEVDIAVPLTSHPAVGTSQTRWKMVDRDGWEFFPDRYPMGLILTIVVREGAPEPDVGPLA